MKHCAWVRKHLIDLMEKTLSEKKRALIHAHCRTCRRCNEEYKKVQRLYAILATQKVQLPGNDVWDSIRERIGQRTIILPRRSWFRTLVPVLVPVAAIAIVIILLVRRPADTIDIEIPVSELLQDEDIATLALQNMITSDLKKDFIEIEKSLPMDIDQTIGEMSDKEQQLLVELLEQTYGMGT